MKAKSLRMICALSAVGMLSGCENGGSGSMGKTVQPEKPAIVTVWNYYNGPQKETFDNLVREFNDTVGNEKHIIVETFSKGSISELTQELLQTVERQGTSARLPQLCAAYTDTAAQLDQKGLLADMTPYLTEEEQAAYIDAYLKEGRFSEDGSLKIFPIAKSTEIMTINLTAWEPFAAETGLELSELSDWEGVAAAAEQYYQWTDAQTPDVPDDGMAFFGRDAFSNYMLLGSYQLGHEIFRVSDGRMKLEFDRDVMHKLWDSYYIPFVRGYYTSKGKFRSDDLKTGSLIAYVGSTSGALYTPERVIFEDGSGMDITCGVLPVPNFADTEPAAVQQGAGMVLLQGEEKTEAAAMEFLKWFTGTDANLEFCLGSGYLPVTKAANSPEVLDRVVTEKKTEIKKVVEDTLKIGMDTVRNVSLYTVKPFANGTQVRDVLETTMTTYAVQDRAEVERMMSEGMTGQEALAHIDSESRFGQWYDETYKKLNSLGE